MQSMLKAAFVVISFIGAGLNAHADDSKSEYTLFNPTPADKMREMSTDRPDRTESAFTVDAGHFQIEMDVITMTSDKTEDSGTTTDSKASGFLVSNLKMGLTNNMDLQLVVSPYQTDKTEVTGAADVTKSGFGDTTLRLKYNFFGNDGGAIAMGIMPFIKFPTASDGMSNDKVEGGVIFPVALSLPGNWGMGVMGQVNRMKNGADDEFHTEFVSSVTAGHNVVGDLGGYVEFYSLASDEVGASWVGTGDLGLTYKITPNVQVDAGANIGLTHAAEDLTTFVGFSARM